MSDIPDEAVEKAAEQLPFMCQVAGCPCPDKAKVRAALDAALPLLMEQQLKVQRALFAGNDKQEHRIRELEAAAQVVVDVFDAIEDSGLLDHERAALDALRDVLAKEADR